MPATQAQREESIGSRANNNNISRSVDSDILNLLVESIDEPMLVLVGGNNTVHWFNESAANILPTIAAGVELSTIDQFLSNEINQVISKNACRKVGDEPIQVNQRFVTDTSIENHKTAYCMVSQKEERYLTVRIPESRIDSAQLQKYMADRELLFTTSRTISVSEMATTLAHEINQPIGSIANILQGTKSRLERIETSDEILNALDRALNQTQFASRIIARIRDFTQSRQPKRQACDVHELLNDSVNLLDWVLAQSAVSVHFHLPQTNVIVNGDATMLQQVFTNLIRNAVEAMSGITPKSLMYK